MEASEGAKPVDPAEEEEGGLRRAIGPRLLLFFIIGDILGGGIYALVGEVGGETGGAIWIAFTVALVMAAFTAGSYAELVSKYPRAGGAGLYVHKAYGNAFFSFMIAFAVAMSGITSAATLSRAFGGDYLNVFIDVDVVLAALALITLIALVNFRGIAESVKLNVGFTVVEVGGLLLIILIAVIAVIQGDADTSRPFEIKEGSSLIGVALAGAALAFYALIGFEDSVNISEEVKDPTRVYPKVIFGGLAIAGVIYLLVTIGASAVVPTADLSSSSGPLLEVVKQGPLGIDTKVFSAIGLLALSNGALINMIMASRLMYGMSREGVLPKPFAAVHTSRKTPWVAIIFTTARGRWAHPRGEPRGACPDNGRAPPDRLHGRQRHRPLASPRPRRPRALPDPVGHPGAWRRRVDRADDAGQGRGLGQGGHPSGHRRRALRDQLGGGP